MEIKEKLNQITYQVGKAMRENPQYRTHKGRPDLISYIKDELNINASMESISRCQRKLWTIALKALINGEFEYAKCLLPLNSEKEFNQFLTIRHEKAEQYKKYFSNGKLKQW